VGAPSPVSVRALVDRFALRGIAMHSFPLCMNGDAVAAVANVELGLTESRQNAVVRRRGSIWCDLYARSKWSRLQTLTYAHGRTVAVFDVLNVDCAVYPSSPECAPRQNGAVERVIRMLSARK
jgi:hypothetical protein